MLSALRSSGSSRICRHRRLSATAAVALAAVVQGGDDPRPLRAATLWSWSLRRCRGPRARFGRCTRPDLILRYGLWLPRHRGSRLIRYRLYGFI